MSGPIRSRELGNRHPFSALFILGFDGPTLPDDVKGLLARGLAGVALFARNLVDADQVRGLCRAIREAARDHPPPIIAVDEEGGRVQRLRRIVGAFPAAREVGKGGAEAARKAGAAIGGALRDLGFNLDFAPVLDVDSNPANPIIGDRAFSPDPDEVARCGVAFLEGLQATGVLACGKHFPGHGDAAADSHLDLPVITSDPDTLKRREVPPFEAAVRAGLPMVMTAHCLYPALDPDHPATLSRRIVGGLLREDLGFDGCVVTDDLGMKAISDRFAPEEVVARGIEAGVDLFLHCGTGGEGLALVETLEDLVRRGAVSRGRVEAAVRRVEGLRRRLV